MGNLLARNLNTRKRPGNPLLCGRIGNVAVQRLGREYTHEYTLAEERRRQSVRHVREFQCPQRFRPHLS